MSLRALTTIRWWQSDRVGNSKNAVPTLLCRRSTIIPARTCYSTPYTAVRSRTRRLEGANAASSKRATILCMPSWNGLCLHYWEQPLSRVVKNEKLDLVSIFHLKLIIQRVHNCKNRKAYGNSLILFA